MLIYVACYNKIMLDMISHYNIFQYLVSSMRRFFIVYILSVRIECPETIWITYNQYNFLDKSGKSINCNWILTNKMNDLVEYYMITDIIYY